MPEFKPPANWVEACTLAMLDEEALVCGYKFGFAGFPEPEAMRCGAAFMHGWRNGRVDGGHAEADRAQELVLYDALRLGGDYLLEPLH